MEVLSVKLVHVKYDNKNIIDRVFNSLQHLSNEYTDFEQWFFCKVIPGLKDGSRKIYAVVDAQAIAGVLILKDSGEKKICTLRVSEAYRNQGIGTKLLKQAFKELKTAKPIITVSSLHLHEFMHLLSKHGFIMKKEYPGYYKTGISVFCFNGFLNETLQYEECV